MKRNRWLMVAGLAVLFVAAPMLAQAPKGVKANIPFKFAVGSKTMPAGEYTVVTANRSLVVQSDKAQVVIASTPVRGENAPESARLIFNRYGDSYFLAKVWDGQHETAFGVPESKREAETAKYHKPATTIVLAEVKK